MVEIRDISEVALPLYRHIIRETANSLQTQVSKYFLYLSTCSPQLVLLTRQNVLCCSINRLFLHFTSNLVEPSLSVSLDCCCGLAALALWGHEKRQVSVGRKHPGRTHAPVCFVIFCPGAQRRANFITFFYQCMTCPVWNTGCEWKENEDWWLLDTAGHEARGKGEVLCLKLCFINLISNSRDCESAKMWC